MLNLLLAGTLILFLAGCNRSSLEADVSGTVTLDDQPIGPGVVVFARAGGGSPAIGTIDAGGRYRLKTSRETGLAAGTYHVSVSIRERPVDIQPGERPPPGKLLIPEKYAQSATSGLEFEVQSGRNTIDIELTSSGSGGPAP